MSGYGGESVRRGDDGSEGGDSASLLIGTEGNDGSEQSFSVQLRECRRMLLL